MNQLPEKQPVDDLFARRLQNINIEPGPDAWEALEKRLPMQSTRSLWIRYRPLLAIAASVLLVVWLSWDNWLREKKPDSVADKLKAGKQEQQQKSMAEISQHEMRKKSPIFVRTITNHSLNQADRIKLIKPPEIRLAQVRQVHHPTTAQTLTTTFAQPTVTSSQPQPFSVPDQPVVNERILVVIIDEPTTQLDPAVPPQATEQVYVARQTRIGRFFQRIDRLRNDSPVASGPATPKESFLQTIRNTVQDRD
jgi:hypothetical protein